uniref:BTB/POZ domain-containing protein 9 n=1 Tax=Myxine glutinosa TaxID=7769 RepID=UPI00358E8E57
MLKILRCLSQSAGCGEYVLAMSDSHQLHGYSSSGEVDHVRLLSRDLGALQQGQEHTDVTFVVEGRPFPAHRIVLASRCEYFRAMLYGGMKESVPQAEVHMQDATAEAFALLLRYVYTGRLSLPSIGEESLLDLLGLAHRLGLNELEQALSEFLCATLGVQSVCTVYDAARLYSLSRLRDDCVQYIDRNATAVLSSEGFSSLSLSAILSILSRDSFYSPERDIFMAVINWSRANPDEDASMVISSVRLHLMSLPDLLNVVRPLGLVSPDVILDAIQDQTQRCTSELNHRGMLFKDENVATPRHGGQVVQGELMTTLLDGDTQSYDLDHGFSRHSIDQDDGLGIVVQLGSPCVINHIRLLLWDRDARSYSYYVELSIDQQDWIRVVDHTQHLCRSWQNLFFPARVCRYIRVMGTYNTVNKVFHLVALESMYSSKSFVLEGGLLVPPENVATVAASASVIEGVSRRRNALLNGDTNNYDWDCGYTCHQLGSGSIVVQLAQPFLVSSIRLLLWDCDDRSYKYYVEVSTNLQQWTRVADRTNMTCKSWQRITFVRCVVSFIRIVGTHNTANEVFHCVHFECPAVSDAGQGPDSVGATTKAISSSQHTLTNPDGDPDREETTERQEALLTGTSPQGQIDGSTRTARQSPANDSQESGTVPLTSQLVVSQIPEDAAFLSSSTPAQNTREE